MTYNIAVVGHVDNGKSSLLSRILFPDAEGDPLKLDILEEEKDRGITQEYSCHSWKDFTFIDTAGHRSFIRSNIIAYTSTDIHLALVICSLRKGEFEAGFTAKSGDMIPPLKEQLYILRSTGVRDVIIVLTKSDLELIEDQTRIIDALRLFFKNIQIKCHATIYVSSKTGEGLQKLLDTIEKVRQSSSRFLTPVKKQLEFRSSRFTCKFTILFVPKGKLITTGCTFVAHSGGEEVECVLEKVKPPLKNPVLELYKEYIVRFVLEKDILLTKRIIIRTSSCTVGYCSKIRAR